MQDPYNYVHAPWQDPYGYAHNPWGTQWAASPPAEPDPKKKGRGWFASKFTSGRDGTTLNTGNVNTGSFGSDSTASGATGSWTGSFGSDWDSDHIDMDRMVSEIVDTRAPHERTTVMMRNIP